MTGKKTPVLILKLVINKMIKTDCEKQNLKTKENHIFKYVNGYTKC